MKVLFSELAKAELDDATHYYELEFEGLGQRFKESVRQAARRMKDYHKSAV